MTLTSTRPPRLHRAWYVAAVAFVAILGAAGFRATPGVLITPLQEEFGWSKGTISAAVSINLVLYGLTAPFAAALMDRFGMRRMVSLALLLVAAGSGLTVLMTASWQLWLCWGVLVGLGTGSMALVFVATVTDRWFVRHRGLVTGVLTAAGATGQLIFLPVLAELAAGPGWRVASLTVTGAALAVVPLVWWLMRDRPEDVGTTALGAEPAISDMPGSGAAGRTSAAGTVSASAAGGGSVSATGTVSASPAGTASASAADTVSASAAGTARASSAGTVRAGRTGVVKVNAAVRAVTVLRSAAGTRAFWYLVGGFAICGASTNGLVGTHFIPAAHDHGMAEPVAAGLLAIIGVFDIVGTVASGWLSDRVDPKVLLGVYYGLRGLSLMILPSLFAESAHPSMLVFIVFYGLDWVATVPPTVALCRRIFGSDGSVVFGWVFASHQIGAAFAAVGAGLTRDHLGAYDLAWFVSGGLCILAAGMSLAIGHARGR
ncbi:MFS transporter [Nonomuraea sediminis]|uniref:MFS transporter n=1 Tax=Nonomuraea sediminis TaxID=2835864 RepID=UPI001BDBC5E6|nr:MFS transporter [Nonomuraea sediminis]